MTTNRRRKQDTRELAASTGTNYQAALALQDEQQDAPAAVDERPPAPAAPELADEVIMHGYPITDDGGDCTVKLEHPDGREISELTRPGGYAWGYGGIGPHALARDILVTALGASARCPECRGAGRMAIVPGQLKTEPFDPARHTEEQTAWCYADDCDGGTVFPLGVTNNAFTDEYVIGWPQDEEFRITLGEVRVWAKGAAAEYAEANHPSWYEPGKRPDALHALDRLHFSLSRDDIRNQTKPWRQLVQELGEVRSLLIAQRAALEAARDATAALQANGWRTRTVGSTHAEQAGAQLANELENTRVRYVALANHALAAAAGEAEPAALPELEPMGEDTFVEPEPVIPESLAARGIRLYRVRQAMPESARLAASYEEDFERYFARPDDHECSGLIEHGVCDCNPLDIPEHETERANDMQERISELWSAASEEAIMWADEVCRALDSVGELRPLIMP